MYYVFRLGEPFDFSFFVFVKSAYFETSKTPSKEFNF